MAIECYGDRDLPTEQLDEDMDRQAILDRLGWTFARVRGSLFFRAPDRAMMPILEKLQLLDIPTKGTGSSGTQASPYLDELTARMIRRAGELREKWSIPGKTRPKSFPVPSYFIGVWGPGVVDTVFDFAKGNDALCGAARPVLGQINSLPLELHGLYQDAKGW